jgi:hypothetical protein
LQGLPPIETIDLYQCKVETDAESAKKYWALNITTKLGKSISLRASSAEERDQWIDAITRASIFVEALQPLPIQQQVRGQNIFLFRLT